MRSGSRSNALLVELMIVVMFFMIAATVLLRVFVSSRQQSDRAELITASMAAAQNTADQLYAAEDPEALLQDLGFVQEDGVWRLSAERYTLEASVAEETEPAGIFRRQSVRVSADGETLYELPCSRWQEVNQ